MIDMTIADNLAITWPIARVVISNRYFISGIFCDILRYMLKTSPLKTCVYLIITTWNRVSFSTYIVFLTKLQKRANPEKRICPIEKRYHRFWIHYQDVGYSKHRSWWLDFKLKS